MIEENEFEQMLNQAKKVLQIEAQAILTLSERLDESLVYACLMIYRSRGKVVVTGMGKSGHIARKIAATLASTGTPAFFVHPAEAAHGDLGMITSEDVVLALSNSGESEEVLWMLPSLKRKKVALIAMTGSPVSTLAQAADVHLNTAVDQEACPMNLAPTASTTAVLALGDALAVTLLQKRGFGAQDFALSHPAGSLGRRLLIRVCDLMRQGDGLPLVRESASVKEALFEVSRKGMGMVAVVDQKMHILGIFTDGDLRRALDKGMDIHHSLVREVMTLDPLCIEKDRLAVEAVQLMEEYRVNGLFVVEDQVVVGALNMHDLLRAKIV